MIEGEKKIKYSSYAQPRGMAKQMMVMVLLCH